MLALRGTGGLATGLVAGFTVGFAIGAAIGFAATSGFKISGFKAGLAGTNLAGLGGTGLAGFTSAVFIGNALGKLLEPDNNGFWGFAGFAGAGFAGFGGLSDTLFSLKLAISAAKLGWLLEVRAGSSGRGFPSS